DEHGMDGMPGDLRRAFGIGHGNTPWLKVPLEHRASSLSSLSPFGPTLLSASLLRAGMRSAGRSRPPAGMFWGPIAEVWSDAPLQSPRPRGMSSCGYSGF